MHQAGILGESFSDAKEFGWKVNSEGHDWGKMVAAIQDHIGSLNFGYRNTLRDNNVTYMNAYGSFVDAHTITGEEEPPPSLSLSLSAPRLLLLKHSFYYQWLNSLG